MGDHEQSTNRKNVPDKIGAEQEVSVPEVEDDDIAAALQAVLSKAGINPEDDPQARILIQRIIASQFNGPIPPPTMLAEYEKAMPGLAIRIVENWEQQREHRQRLEIDTTAGSEKRMDRSQRNAMVIAALGLVIAAGLGYFGATTVAIFVAVVSVGGPNAATIISRFIKPPS